MSERGFERILNPSPEAATTVGEAQVAISSARDFITDTALDRAVALQHMGVPEIKAALNADHELTEEELDRLSGKGRQLFEALLTFRKKVDILAGGIRPDAEGASLATYVGRLEEFKAAWHGIIQNEQFVASTSDLIERIKMSDYGIKTPLLIGMNPLLSSEARKALEKLEKTGS